MSITSVIFDIDGTLVVRTEILQAARARLSPSQKAVYIGDGEWDREACEALGWPFVGVGERLCGRCMHWVPDLSSDRILSMLIEGYGDR